MTVRQKIEALERRLSYLTSKMDAGEYSDAAASWAWSERKALEWAIPQLRADVGLVDVAPGVVLTRGMRPDGPGQPGVDMSRPDDHGIVGVR